MPKQQPQDHQADYRQKGTIWVRFRFQTVLLWGNGELSSEPPWIIWFDLLFNNLKLMEGERERERQQFEIEIKPHI